MYTICVERAPQILAGKQRILNLYSMTIEKLSNKVSPRKNIYRSTLKVCGEQFKIIVGVLQGCVLSPLLFNIFLKLKITTALEDVEIDGVGIDNLCFADDSANELQSNGK